MQGLEAGMHKQILYTGLRLGLYDHLTAGETSVSIPEKIAFAGMLQLNGCHDTVELQHAIAAGRAYEEVHNMDVYL